MRKALMLPLGIVVAMLVFCGAERSQAAVLATLTEDGGDLLLTANGTIDLTGLTSIGAANFAPFICPNGCGAPSGIFVAGPTGIQTADRYYLGIGVPAFFGSSPYLTADSGSGDFFGMSGFTGQSVLLVPEGYSSGELLSGSSIFENATFASLGLITGVYTYTLPNDTVTLRIGEISAAPIPAALPLFLTMLSAMGGLRWWRQRKTA